MTWVLEHMYVYTGLPWWAVIGLSAAAIRVIFFKVFVNAAKNSAKMHAIQPIAKPLTDKMTAAARANDTNTVMQIRAQLKRINQEAGIKLSRSFLPALQIFPASGTFFTLRMMSNVPVPALETGGILWFQNLTLADPYFILPIVTSFMLYRSLKVSFPIHTPLFKTHKVQTLTRYQTFRKAEKQQQQQPKPPQCNKPSNTDSPPSPSSSPPSCPRASNSPSSSPASAHTSKPPSTGNHGSENTTTWLLSPRNPLLTWWMRVVRPFRPLRRCGSMGRILEMRRVG